MDWSRLTENGPRFRSRRWIGFQLIIFGLFASIDGVVFFVALIDGQVGRALFRGLGLVFFGLLFAGSIAQWHRYGHSKRNQIE